MDGSSSKSGGAVMQRYYVHGDRTSEGTVYCARCDQFVKQVHFYKDCRSGNDFLRYQQSLKACILATKGGRFDRPKNAPNIFA